MASNSGSTEYDFVEIPSQEYFCPVTFELLKDPRQTNYCCGKHLSRAAAEQLWAMGKPCPLCKAPRLRTTKDLFFKRKVMELKVYCSNKSAGCEWKGELGESDRHLDCHLKLDGQFGLDGQCGFVEVQCSLKCGKCIQRRHLVNHQTNECENRPFACKYCDYKSSYDKVVNDHMAQCQRYPEVCPNKCSEDVMERRRLKRHLNEECHLEEIECKFSHAGCQTKMKRQEMQDHLESTKDGHLELVSAQCKKLKTEISDLKFVISKITPRPMFIPPPEIVVDDFEKLKNDGEIWFSPPFYTHVGGYNMCLGIDAGENVEGSGGDSYYVGVYIYVMKGEFDSHLKWPFKGEITVCLVNQKEGGENFIKRIRVTERSNAKEGWGFPEFISHTDLYSPEEGKEYLKNDTLIFKVTKVVVTFV